MNPMNEHLTWEELNDFVDDVFAPDEAARAIRRAVGS